MPRAFHPGWCADYPEIGAMGGKSTARQLFQGLWPHRKAERPRPVVASFLSDESRSGLPWLVLRNPHHPTQQRLAMPWSLILRLAPHPTWQVFPEFEWPEILV